MSANLNFTPPAVKTKTDASGAPAAKAEKPVKAPKVAKEPTDPNAPKKERAPKNDYGYSKLSVIAVTEKDPGKMRGARREWYDNIAKFAGKTCGEVLKAYEGAVNGKGKPHSISGWMNFFAKEGFIKLTRPPQAEKPAKAEKAPAVAASAAK